MLKTSTKVLAAIFLTTFCAKIGATGDFEPITWLEDGGKEIIQAPEFFWEIECKRIAKEFTPPEKRICAPASNDANADSTDGLNLQQFTAKKDIEDFTAAVKSGYVKAADADAAIKAHTAARDLIQTIKPEAAPAAPDPNAKTAPAPAPTKPASLPTLPAEADSEFADYHKGALAFHAEDYPVAKAAWEALLKRPAAERKYRSTWAAYMLGKLALDQGDHADAVKYFQMTRQLAKDGFADSLGLAAESYGWEASAVQAEDPGKAVRLYLTQLGAGDASAVGSLSMLMPVLPMPNPGAPAPTDPASVKAAKATQDELEEAAKDPLLRRLVTCLVLSSIEKDHPGDDSGADTTVHKLWLGIMEKLGVKDQVDAENLGWVAYVAGQYDEAARWLKLSTGKTPAAHWLKAKLALREGKVAEASTELSEAVKGLQDQEELENTMRDGPAELPYQSTRGDLGTVLLSRGDFIQTLDIFLEANLWVDAAYVAERCLTTKELLDYAAKHFSTGKVAKIDAKGADATDADATAKTQSQQFRALVARRLVREDNYKEARRWFTPEMLPVLDDYTAALAKGNNEKTSKHDRARALFHAGWLARNQGMELMGTEDGPDNAGDYGNSDIDLAVWRLTGKPQPTEDGDQDNNGNDAPKPALALPVSAAEKARLAATKVNPELRWHYRLVAAGLAWKAAALLPDGTDETVDVLNTAGSWLKDKHEKQADRFYQAIERRCSKTEIGKAAVKVHWFVDQEGPWSAEEAAADKAKEDAAQKKADEEAAKREAESAKTKGNEAK